ncbi:MAG: peroxiredoxin family protein [Planctomycetota bacterium]
MPRLIALYEKHRDLRDRFEILAISNSEVASLAELDERTARIRARHWGGKPLPFPLLLDDEGLTAAEFGVSMFPTFMLVDPDGKVVERGDPKRLEAELAKLASARKKIERR